MKWGKVILIIFGALIITALGIDAADTLTGSKSTLLSQVVGKKQGGPCGDGMVEITHIPSLRCVDAYEVSAGEMCPQSNPQQMVATQQNLENSSCTSNSKAGVEPWRYITRDQAMQLCARSGKRLPTSEEWYQLGLGMTDVEKNCNVSSKAISRTGEYTTCSSAQGVYDLVGNAWEWVRDDVINGTYNANQVPDSGYVSQVDAHGIATVVSESPQELFNNDYFWSRREGAFGIIRGGYYDSGTDGGIYTVHADTPPTTASAGIGFRCVQ